MISVVIPTYNEKQLPRAIQSVQKNTVTDWELLIVDDGSTDDTEEWVSELADQDGRIRYIPLSHHGVSAARNKGIDEAAGDAIVFLDADDELAPSFLQTMGEMLEKEEADWVACNWSDENGVAPAVFSEETVLSQADCQKVREAVFYGQGQMNLFSACTGMYRLSFLKEHALRFDETVDFGEDTLFNAQAAGKVERFGYLPQALYIYHRKDEKEAETGRRVRQVCRLLVALLPWREEPQAVADAFARYETLQLMRVLVYNIYPLEKQGRQKALDFFQQEIDSRPALANHIQATHFWQMNTTEEMIYWWSTRRVEGPLGFLLWRIKHWR